jgi:hypothetical protein
MVIQKMAHREWNLLGFTPIVKTKFYTFPMGTDVLTDSRALRSNTGTRISAAVQTVVPIFNKYAQQLPWWLVVVALWGDAIIMATCWYSGDLPALVLNVLFSVHVHTLAPLYFVL